MVEQVDEGGRDDDTRSAASEKRVSGRTDSNGTNTTNKCLAAKNTHEKMGVCIHLIARIGMHTPRAEARSRTLRTPSLSKVVVERGSVTYKTEAICSPVS